MPKDKTRTPEAALGQPSDEHATMCGQLRVPYLSWSFKELRQLREIPQDADEQVPFFFALIQRRLPDLTLEQFEEACGPVDIQGWFTAVNGGGDQGNA